MSDSSPANGEGKDPEIELFVKVGETFSSQLQIFTVSRILLCFSAEFFFLFPPCSCLLSLLLLALVFVAPEPSPHSNAKPATVVSSLNLLWGRKTDPEALKKLCSMQDVGENLYVCSQTSISTESNVTFGTSSYLHVYNLILFKMWPVAVNYVDYPLI